MACLSVKQHCYWVIVGLDSWEILEIKLGVSNDVFWVQNLFVTDQREICSLPDYLLQLNINIVSTFPHNV